MFGYLPDAIKQQVIYYLQNDNFRAAKELYDTWRDCDESSTDNNNNFI
jgi:hypothetical protein